MRRSSQFRLGILALLFTSTCQALSGPDCRKCDEKRDELQRYAEDKRKTMALLGKNREYLAMLGPKQASKFLKVQSNTLAILKKIEGINQATETALSAYEKEGCTQCPQKI